MKCVGDPGSSTLAFGHGAKGLSVNISWDDEVVFLAVHLEASFRHAKAVSPYARL